MSWDESWWITRNIVKSIQRGKTSTAQTVTINRVNLEKSIVLSVSKGSAGYVAARGSVTGKSFIIDQFYADGTYSYVSFDSTNSHAQTIGGYSSPMSYINLNGSIIGGSTDLTVKQYSATLTSPTTLVSDGACEWQVIEFY